MAYSPMKKSCIKMYDKKGKQSGLMMEGSVAHMETMGQEKKNLMKDMPVDSKASAMKMSPYKMDHPGESGEEKTKTKKKKPTTTLKNALASDEDYQVVPGFEERLGGELEEVVVTASARNNTSDSGGALPTKRKTYSKVGNFLRGVNPLSTKYERVRARTRLGQDRFL